MIPTKYLKFPALGVLILCITAVLSCKKNSTNPSVTANALVLNYGDPAADGCGWIIKITGTDSTYSPVTLADAYKTDSLKVTISYTLADSKFNCGWLPGGGVTQIKLGTISKQ